GRGAAVRQETLAPRRGKVRGERAARTSKERASKQQECGGLNEVQFAFGAAASGAGAGVSAAAAPGAARWAPVKRSSTERTASRVLRSFTASRSGAEAGERRIRLSGSGKISGSSHGPCTTNGSSKPGEAFAAEVRLATPFRSYSRSGTEAVPVRVRRGAGPSTRTSSRGVTPRV